jgi:O-antigen/teichoic acid export membrane protein
MLRSLVRNVAISAVAFFAVSVVGLLLVPVLIRQYGIAGFGYISIGRLFLPTAALGIFDFGFGENATQAVARARVDQDWARCSRMLGLVFGLAAAVGVAVAMVLAALAPKLPQWLSVSIEQQSALTHVFWVSAGMLPLLYVSLALEGVIKGFEHYVALRGLEVFTSLCYAGLVLGAVSLDLSANMVCYALLAAQGLRAGIGAILAWRAWRPVAIRPARAQVEDRAAFRAQTKAMAANKLLGTTQTQLAPLLIGLMFGPVGVGTFDALSRLPRAAKAVLGLLSSTILPIAARLESAADAKGLRRLGQAGVLMIGLATLPPLAATMAFSEPLLHAWVGPDLAALAIWQAAMFVVPALSVLLSFGGTALLVRPDVVAAMNRLTLVQLALQFGLALAAAHWLQERAFILGQVCAVTLTFIPLIRLICRELDVPERVFAQLGVLLAVLVALGLPAAWFASAIRGWPTLGLTMLGWTLLCWVICFRLVLTTQQRDKLLGALRGFIMRH